MTSLQASPLRKSGASGGPGRPACGSGSQKGSQVLSRRRSQGEAPENGLKVNEFAQRDPRNLGGRRGRGAGGNDPSFGRAVPPKTHSVAFGALGGRSRPRREVDGEITGIGEEKNEWIHTETTKTN